MVLEDEYALRISIEEFLNDLGFEVISFERGDELLDALYSEPCDALLLDVKVPGINGFELLKELREAGNEIPAIFITSMTHVDDLARGFELGCCDYIKKPFDLKELEVRLRNVLKRECFGAKKEIVELPNGYTYDLAAFELKQNGKSIPLTKQEKRILELLIKQRGNVVSIEQFCDEVWGEYVDSANIRVHITKLRKKIGKDIIKNVHGLGYKIDS
ncbi:MULTISPECIES: response regulator transcription factor [Nitratiruptor]|nr:MULTISPECIES: response regulator transcription factor [Nitratiruptor]